MSATPPGLPDGLRIYAVGDIHGCFDVLEALYERIRCDLQSARPRESLELFLGDYVDRGPRSREVVEWMISTRPACDRRICLMGNHEDMLLNALADPAAMEHWLSNGGIQTLLSYKSVPLHILAGMTLIQAHRDFSAAFPDAHRRFMSGLLRSAEFGDYIFVHAGLRPGRTLAQQDTEDLVWVREPFLSSAHDFGKLVVHGHTPSDAPEIRPNRINIDTGAVFGGSLTCLVLEGSTRRFLQVR